MQIRCLGYVDEETTSLKRVVDLMGSIMTGSIERPELELVEVRDNEEEVIHLAALFTEGEGEFIGWLVSRRVANSRRREVFCNENIGGSKKVQALFCGACEEIENSAILSTDEAGCLVSLLVEGRELVEYCAVPLSDVIS